MLPSFRNMLIFPGIKVLNVIQEFVMFVYLEKELQQIARFDIAENSDHKGILLANTACDPYSKFRF